MSIRTLMWSIAAALLWSIAGGARAESRKQSDRSFFFENIPSNAPIADLLPLPPKAATRPAWPMKDLAAVPEVFFQDPQALPVSPKASDRAERIKRARDVSKEEVDRIRKKFGKNLTDKEITAKLDEEAVERENAEERIAFQIFRVNVLNQKGPDHFMEVLRENRPDLAGLPFVMGKACRLGNTEHRQFAAAVALVQGSLGPVEEDPQNFWRYYEENRAEQKNFAKDEKKFPVPDGRMCVAALTQMLPVESAELQLSLVGRLEHFDKTPADKKAVTLALARLAVFSQEPAIRQAAVDRLKKRDSRPATGILLQGLRYPWPSIAQSAAEAIVQLQRKDLVPELTKVLKEPDPRAPESVEVKGTKVSVVRELVRINHMRNCLLCHPPLLSPESATEMKDAESGLQKAARDNGRRHHVDVLSAKEVAGTIPPPGHSLQTGSPERGGGYGFSTRDQQIRADVTYLRQDFSLLQRVPDADPWPEMQRFDFLVRTRVVNVEEANMIRTALAGRGSPYVTAAQDALRRLAGKDAAPTASD